MRARACRHWVEAHSEGREGIAMPGQSLVTGGLRRMSLAQTHCLSSELSIVVSFGQLEQESSTVYRLASIQRR